MACKISTLHILLLLLSLSQLLPSSSPTPHDDEEFKRWVSWNVQNYRQRTITTQQNTAMGSPRSFDMKLAKAEAAAVIYIVSQDGSGDFESIRAAVESISLPNKKRVVLEIRPGIYSEKIVIPKTAPFITFLGSSENLTTITGNDTSTTKGADGRPMSTFHSSTVAVNANYFVAVNIKFENSAGIGGQAVALRISGDKAAFYNCSFYGTQDTLYDHKGLHYFNNCFIQGSVDFIFGNGRSLYENCYLNSIAKNKASMTAQRRSNTTIESGFSFTKSTVTGSGLVYLGRPWGDRSRVVFSYTFMDKVVVPQGWNNWHIQRPVESGVYYGEYKCSGPGANWTGRVQWARQLTDEEAQPFLGTYYVYGDSWILGPLHFKG